jgi:Na+/melibiose symporter-like transporter
VIATHRLPPGRLLAYGLLGFPLAALNLPLYVYLPPFYAKEVGLGLTTVGVVLFLARLLDTLTDPLIGELSDRLPTRFGRRRPWVVLACPLLLGATWLLFVPLEGAGPLYLFFWTSVAYVAWTLMILPYSAWGAELSDGYHERSRITGAREGCVIVGIVFAAAVPWLLGVDADTETGRVLEVLALSMAVVLPVALVLLLVFVPEAACARERPLGFIQGLKIARRNRAFVRLVVAFLANSMANGLPATLFILFVTHVLQIPERVGPLLLVYFLAGVVAIPFWLWLSYQLGKHRAWSCSMIWACLAFVWVPLLGPGDFWPFLIICTLSGLSLGADLALPSSIQADVVDLDWLESGRRRTGLFFAVWGMATKVSLALAVGFAFPVLDWLGFSADGDNSPRALLGLAALYGLVPVLIKFGAIALVWNFPIDAADQARIRARIEQATGPQSEGAPA